MRKKTYLQFTLRKQIKNYLFFIHKWKPSTKKYKDSKKKTKNDDNTTQMEPWLKYLNPLNSEDWNEKKKLDLSM